MAAVNREQLSEAIFQLTNAQDARWARHWLQEFPWIHSSDVDDWLTGAICEQYLQNQMPYVCLFTAVRGLLRRCQSEGIQAALAMQLDWPLATYSPLTQLLALDEVAPVDESLKWGNLALEDVDRETEPGVYGLVMYRLGLVYHDQAQAGVVEAFAPAMTCFETAVDTLPPVESPLGQALRGRAQHNLAHLFLDWSEADRSQNVEQALTWLAQAQISFGQTGIEYVNVLMLQGNAYLGRIQGERLHNIEQGIDLYKKAYEAATSQSHHTRLSEIEHNLAVAYRVRLHGRRADNYEKALHWAQQALERLNRQKAPEAWARTVQELAVIYAHRHLDDRAENIEQAIAHAKDALTIYQSDTHPRQWALAMLTLGNLYCDCIMGDPVSNHQQAIDIFEAILKTRDKDAQPVDWADAINNLGTAYAGLSQRPFDKPYRQAMDCFQKALAVHGPDKLPARARRTAVNQGNLAFRFRQWQVALDAFQAAKDAGERLFQASGTKAGRQVELAENAGVAAKAAFCWLQLGQPERAFWKLEQGKTRLLAEALSLRNADLSVLSEAQQQAVAQLRQGIRELEAEMRLFPATPSRRGDIELGEMLVQARQSLWTLIDDIRERIPDFLKIEAQPYDLADLIPVSGALVAPLITAQGSVCFVVPHGSPKINAEHIVPLPDFSVDVQNHLLVGTEAEPGWVPARRQGIQFWLTAVTRLTQHLWPIFAQPIATRLEKRGITKLLILPQGGLQLLPLHAAWHQANGDKHYFIDDFEISYAPSISVLALAQKRLAGREGKNALIAGIGEYKSREKLAFACFEAEQVAYAFKTDPLLNDQATRKAVLDNAPGKNYLHLACHASFNWEDTLASALYLANDEPLFMGDVIEYLDLATMRLVTLSACDTGLIDVNQLPDEFIGLPAGFMQAGTPAVISSLWQVEDRSTAFLMDKFYEVLRDEKLPPPTALRKAQLWLRQYEAPRHENPFFWAAFTFYGI